MTTAVINPGDRVELSIPAWLAKEKGFASREVGGTVLRATGKALQVRAHVMVRECEFCQNCGRAIDNPASRLLGFGPICSDNLGLPHAETYASLSPAEREAIRNRIAVATTQECWFPRSKTEIRAHEPGVGDEREGGNLSELRPGGEGGERGDSRSLLDSQGAGAEGVRVPGSVLCQRESAVTPLAAESTTPNLDRFLGIPPRKGQAETPEEYRARWAKADAYLNDPDRVAQMRAGWENAKPVDAPPQNPRRVLWDAGAYRVIFPYAAEVVTAIKRIPGARFTSEPEKYWTVPEGSGADLLRFAAEHGFEVDGAAAAQAEAARLAAERNLAESRAAEAEFHVDGLGGTLRPFQAAGVRYMVRARRGILADAPGLGKTIQYLALVQHLDAFPAVVVVPASLKRNWAREALRWLPGRTVQVLDGARVMGATWGPDGALVLAQAHSLSADFVIVNYDILMRKGRDGELRTFRGWVDPHPVEEVLPNGRKRITYVAHGPLAEYAPKALGFDEGHMLIGHKIQRSIAVQALADSMVERHGLDGVVLLDMTGTPFSARAADALKPLQIVHRLDDLGGWFAFATRYCGFANGVMGAVPVPAAALEELNERLRATCYVRRLKKEVLRELPDKVRTTVPMQIDNRKEYERAERDVLSWAAEQAAADEAFNESLAALPEDEQKRRRRERADEAKERAANAEHLVRIGALKKLAARGKMSSVKDWVQNFLASGEKIVLGAWHQDVVEELAAQFGAPYIHGGVSLAARDAAVTRFQRCARCGVLHDKHDGEGHDYEPDMSCPVIVLNIQSGGVGLTLTAASNMGIVELGWRPKDMDQLEDRIHRIGQKDGATIWYLLAESTIEEDIARLIDATRVAVDAATEGEGREESPSIMAELLDRMAARAATT